MESVNTMGLLDILAAKSGCIYLSELSEGRTLLLPHDLMGIEAEAFSLWEWEDAVSYLTGEELSFETPEQAKQYLIGRTPQKSAESNERTEISSGRKRCV